MKKFLFILIILFFTIPSAQANSADSTYYLTIAENNYKSWEKYKRDNYLDYALTNFYQCYLLDPNNIDALVGLSKVYVAKKDRKKAKQYIQLAKNVEFTNPKVNFYIGEYYFFNEDYLQALTFYLYSIHYGYAKIYKVNLQTAITLEKLGDKENAIKYYKIAQQLNPGSTVPAQRIKDMTTQKENPIKDSLFEDSVFDDM